MKGPIDRRLRWRRWRNTSSCDTDSFRGTVAWFGIRLLAFYECHGDEQSVDMVIDLINKLTLFKPQKQIPITDFLKYCYVVCTCTNKLIVLSVSEVVWCNAIVIIYIHCWLVIHHGTTNKCYGMTLVVVLIHDSLNRMSRYPDDFSL